MDPWENVATTWGHTAVCVLTDTGGSMTPSAEVTLIPESHTHSFRCCKEIYILFLGQNDSIYV